MKKVDRFMAISAYEYAVELLENQNIVVDRDFKHLQNILYKYNLKLTTEQKAKVGKDLLINYENNLEEIATIDLHKIRMNLETEQKRENKALEEYLKIKFGGK